ncbi:hypothetical protein OIU78_025987, partial [Salix suchowensis]
MSYSHCLPSSKGPLGSIWVAAYFFKKLKKAQVTSTDISSSVDKILQDVFDVVTCRVLAYLLLGVVRIYSKKAEYLFDDCNKVLLNVKDFVLSNKDGIHVETLQAPYFSITLPERFELDAFDLEIIEDTSGGNVMPHEKITLTDGMWKIGGVGKYSLNQDHREEFAAFGDTWFADYSMNEDIFSSHSVDVMEQGTLRSVSTLQASMEKLQGSMFSHHECLDLEMFLEVEEPTNTRKSLVEDHLTDGEGSKVPDKIGMDETHAGTSVQKLCGDSVYQEASLNLEMFGGVEEEPGKLTKLYHHSEEQQKDVPGAEQSENDTQSVVKDGNVSDVEVSIQKLLESRFFQEEWMDANTFLVVEEPPEHTRPFIEEHQSNEGNKSLLETTTLGKRKRQLVSEDHPLYVKLDATPQSKFKDVSGANTPEFMVISTPAAKEHARVLRKRKCLFDDVIVFPNNVIKQCIEDTGDLVSKRRKLPHTAFAVWKACRFSNLDKCFLESLIPCTSLELGSLFRTKRLQIQETVKSVGGSVETVEPSINSDASPDIYDEDGQSSKLLRKFFCRNLDQELDLNLLNEDMNTSGDNQEHYGWSERTRVAVKCLHASFLIQKKRRQEEVLNLLRLLEGRTKKESARLFYEIL